MTFAQFHAFTGTPDSVARHLYALPRDVVERPLWALLLHGSGGAQVLLQQRAEAGADRARVLSWQGRDLGALPARLATLLAGSAYGELAGALLAHGDYTDLGIVPCPATARGAFGHPLRHHEGQPEVRAFVLAH
ncbi:hypothetical protein [Kitasatospora sp. NPDC057223]|jgi:hypothetical protein|uniref:hypothetical protein n=1 Tax=Kitasatospora sp. NPDC057223 TaxID=3346055 RepID=UPI003641DBF8